MFEKVSRSLKYDSNFFFVHKHSRCACGVTNTICHTTQIKLYPYQNIPFSGYFSGGGGGGGGVKFSWMLGFVVIHGKKIVVGSGLNHTPRARVELWPLV